jgi:uncharacterized membrane protein
MSLLADLDGIEQQAHSDITSAIKDGIEDIQYVPSALDAKIQTIIQSAILHAAAAGERRRCQ